MKLIMPAILVMILSIFITQWGYWLERMGEFVESNRSQHLVRSAVQIFETQFNRVLDTEPNLEEKHERAKDIEENVSNLYEKFEINTIQHWLVVWVSNVVNDKTKELHNALQSQNTKDTVGDDIWGQMQEMMWDTEINTGVITR